MTDNHGPRRELDPQNIIICCMLDLNNILS